MTTPTHLHFAEAEHVVSNPSYYSDSYIATCQRFLDLNDKEQAAPTASVWSADGKQVIALHNPITPDMIVDIKDN